MRARLLPSFLPKKAVSPHNPRCVDATTKAAVAWASPQPASRSQPAHASERACSRASVVRPRAASGSAAAWPCQSRRSSLRSLPPVQVLQWRRSACHERLTRWRFQHRDRNVCNSVATLLTVSSKSASSSRGACSFCAHSASRLSSACCSVALASCHELSLRATGAHVVRSSLASAVLLCWSKSNDRRARTCSVAVVSTVDAAPAVRRASAHAPAHGARAAVCMPAGRGGMQQPGGKNMFTAGESRV